ENEVLAIVRDISQRKLQDVELRQQARFIETLLDSVPNPLFYMDTTGVYLGVNRALKEFYGIEAEDIVGKNIFDLSFEDDAENRNASDLAIFEGREGQQVLEREIKLKDGTLKNALITKSPFPNSEGKIGGLIGIIVDITERKRMEEDLRNAKNKAEESDRLKTSFLNNLSHEIRTPMNAIVGFADLLDMGYPPEQQKGFIATINNNADQLLRIIDDVLTIAKFDSEKLSIKTEPFVLNMLFKDLFETFEPEAKKHQLSLIVDTKNLPDDYIFIADRIKIRQVLAGFISNALKYTTKGEIRFGAEITENDLLRFYTADTGLGIVASEQEKVFDRFYRTNEAQHLAIRGNGLGLSIAKELVELMDGKIYLKSEAGKGSEFSFVLKSSAKAS
ncbi:MAG: PAS domain S-box protein, partial [Bacteroidales bacterium]|nr:PAS domain S-box protein [Bacteroidales bacterium]